MRMLEAVKSGEIDCIVVKDLSRFGREYIDSGVYIQKLFPMLGVRFIAINDHYDNAQPGAADNELVLPFKNLMNDSYCRDISIKVRSNLDAKRRSGQFVGTRVVFGYMRSPNNKNQLVVDPEAASVVQDIFKWKLEGLSPAQIADRLNDNNVPSPIEYKKAKGSKQRTCFQTNQVAQWSAVAIYRMDIAFKNLIYDYYSKDLSKKVKSAMGMKQREAKYVCCIPYGYKAHPTQKHQMIIDPETAPVVRRIYMDVIAGKSCTQIAKELNNEGVPTPAQHKAVTRQASAKKPQWTHRALLGMIENIKYTGTMVNHTRESRFIRDKNQRRVPKEEWYIRENAHEAIVTQEEYDQAQDAIQRRKKSSRTSHDQSDRVYYCGHCGGKLEKANGTVFACPSHRYHDGSPCEQVRWRKAALEEVVLEALKGQIEIIRLEASDAKKAAKSKGDSLQRQLTLLKAQYDACGREKFTKYEEYREGKLTAEEYLASKDVLTAKQVALKEQLDECEAQYDANHQKSLAATAQQQTVTRMSGLSDDKLREHLYDAVERILVYDAESIEIVWKFNEIKKDTDNNVGVGA